MSTPPLTVDQFAAKIKALSPDYAAMPNDELAKKVLEKHPQYWPAINAGDFAKRGMWQPASTGTKTVKPVQQPTPTAAGRFMNAAAPKVLDAAPAVLGTAGGVAGGLVGGGVGAVPGAVAGGAAGEALKEKLSGESASGKKIAKEGAVQGAWEAGTLGIGQAAKGVGALAKSVGLDEAMMKFALRAGEDLPRGLNPAEVFAKWNLKAATTKELWTKVVAKANDLSATKNSIITQALPTSNSIRPYAIIKDVLDKYEQKAIQTVDPEIRKGMQNMLKELHKTSYGPNSPSQLMDIQEADKLKSMFGETVNWGKKAADNKLEDIYRAEVAVRREIYGALNSEIKAASGQYGRALGEVQKDMHNVLEAKRLLEEAAAGHAAQGHSFSEILLNAMRRPGPSSMAASGARTAGRGLQGATEGAQLGAQVVRNRALLPQGSPMPTPTPQNNSQPPQQ